MPKTAYVTGATGFLGLNLIQELTRRGWNVVALHQRSVDVRYLSKFKVEMRGGDLSEPETLLDSMPEGVDAVFHLAANTSAWSKNDARQYVDNVEGTRNMVEAALKKKVGRFVYTSSISAYGYHPGVRIDETASSNALDCGMQYNRTKFLAEKEVKEAVRRGLNAIILNPCNIIGPYDTNNWTRQFIKPICDGKLRGAPPGKAMWCHVKDVVDAHIAAVEKGMPGENYLLGGTEASFLEVVNEIERQMGKPETSRVQPPWLLRLFVAALAVKSAIDGKEPILTPEKYNRAVAYIACDYRKAVATLGYASSPLELMIKDTLAWLESENLL